MHKLLQLAGCFGIALQTSVLIAAPAPDAASPSDSETSVELSEVIVTARRTSEPLERVPVAIDAFSQEQLTERSVKSAVDLGKLSPGLIANSDSGNSGLTTFAIRGRGQQYGAATGSVETYFADIPLSSTFQIPAPPPQFFDIDSIQVLKGPQGTLFGRNTTGGAVVIVPVAPKLDLTGGYLRLQGGTHGDFQAEGALNLPLGDKAALRVGFFDWQRDGYMHTSATDIFTGQAQRDSVSGNVIGAQTFNNVDTTQVRASLLIEPIEALQNTTVISYLQDQSRSSSAAGLMQGPRVAPTAANPFGLTILPEPKCGTYCSYLDVDLDKPASRYWIVANTTKWDPAENFSIKNILGYINSAGYTNDAADADGISLALIDLPVPARPKKDQQYTDELQLSGNLINNKLTYLLGGMYDKTSQPTGTDTINPYSASYSGAASGYLVATNFQSTNITSKAAYGSLTLEPVSGLRLTGGYRHTWIDLVQTEGAAGTPVDTPLPSAPMGELLTKSTSYQGNTYNMGVDYQLTSDAMVYTGYRYGWKRGGFNPSARDSSSFAPETVNDYTVGLKTTSRLWEAPARFNIEFFYDSYHDMQTFYLALGATQLITYTVNVPKARYEGFDTDFSVSPLTWLDLYAAYSYNNARVTQWPDPSAPPGTTPADLAVNPIPYNIRNKVTATVRLHSDLPNGIGELVFSGSVNYQSLYYNTAFGIRLPAASVALFGFDNTIHQCAGGLCSATVPAYTTGDLRLELNHAFSSRFDLAMAVTNVANKLFYTGSTDTLNYGAEGFAYGPPRMFIFEVSMKF